jgi:hypothetical protein
MLSLMTKRAADEDLMNVFVLQFDVHLAENHEFYLEYVCWYNRLADDTTRSYEGLWTLVHVWARRKKDTKNRREALKDHLPGLARDITPTGKGKGTGKDKNGDPQICFAWRNHGACAKKDAGTCIYTHPNDAKGKGKHGGGKKAGDGKGGKRSSSQSRTGKGGAGGGARPASPGRKVVTDKALLCSNFLKGRCSKGGKCKYHHNGICNFHKRSNCTRGDDCVFSHHEPPTPAAAAAVLPDAAAPKGTKKNKDDA